MYGIKEFLLFPRYTLDSISQTSSYNNPIQNPQFPYYRPPRQGKYFRLINQGFFLATLLAGLPPLYPELQDIHLFLSITTAKERPFKTVSHSLTFLARNVYGFYNGPSP